MNWPVAWLALEFEYVVSISFNSLYRHFSAALGGPTRVSRVSLPGA